MASVEVFVDDAVRGRFPSVCAKTGEPAVGVQRIVSHFGGLGLAWLLVLLGPFGWLLLLLIALSHRREVLTVRIPMSRAACDAERDLIRARLLAWLVAAGAFFSGYARLLAVAVPVPIWMGLAVAAACVAVVLHVVLQFRQVGVRLDASRRWVTLSGVHPDFVTAVREWQAQTEFARV
jgi:hypothetical protein